MLTEVNMIKKLNALLISAIMISAIAFPTSLSFADSSSGEDSAVLDGQVVEGATAEEIDKDSVMGSSIDEETESYGDDEDSVTLYSTSKAWKTVSSGKYYNGSGQKILSGAVAKGVDVSRWQGTINWSKAKNDGVEFAIIRLGWGQNYTSQDDSKLKYNVQQCEKYGIPYGFYLYSYADTSAKCNSEIEHVKRLLKGTNPTYPVYYDLEDSKTSACSKATIQNFALTFCKQIKAAGYTPGIYASYSWWTGKLNTASLDSYERWVAQWNKTGCTYTRSWKLWQCADNYYVNGISGKVDLNFAYKTFTKKTTQTSNVIEEQDSTTSSASSQSKTGWVTKSGKKYYYYASNKMYKNKYVKIGNYYYGFDSKGVMYKSKTVKISGKRYAFASNGHAYLKRIKTKARLHYRTGAAKRYTSKGIYKKGKTLYVVRKSNGWWQTAAGYWVCGDYVKVTRTYPY